jgi:hypothetical protein
MALAMSSFPVPVSPRIKTVESVAATLSTAFKTFRRDGEEPTISSNRGVIYVFTKGNVFVFRSVFSAPAIINVGSRRIPAHQTSMFVVERFVTEEEPVILTVLPEHSLLDFKRHSASQTSFFIFAHPLEIFRMENSGAKVRGKYLLHGEAGVVEHRLIRVERVALRVQDDNAVGYSIGNPAKLPLVLKEFRLRSFSIFDIGIASKPPDNVASSVELWDDTYEEPTVLSVISSNASFQFAWFAGIHQGKPFTKEPIQVVGVNDHLPTPTFSLFLGQTGVPVPALVQIFLGSVREARPQERRNRVDDGLEPGSFLAELFERVAQLVAFRIFDRLTHARSAHRAAKYHVSNSESRAKGKPLKERCRSPKASVWRLLNFVCISRATVSMNVATI